MKHFLSGLRESLLEKNPALVSPFGLVGLLLSTITLWDSLLFAAMTGVCLLLSSLVLFLLLRFLPEKGAWRTVAFILINVFVGVCLCVLARHYLPNHEAALGKLLPLLPATAFMLLEEKPKAPLSLALPSALQTGIAYGITLAVVGFLRELLGSGSIFGHVFMKPVLPFFTTTVGAFLLTASLAALLKFLLPKGKEEPA